MAVSAENKNAGTGWRAVVLEMLVGFREAVSRFPLATMFLLAAAVQANLLITDIRLFDLEGHGRATFSELVTGLASGALAALAATLFGEARGLSGPFRSTMALVAGLIAAALVGLPYTFLSVQWTLILALLGFVLVAPFVGRGGNGSFWMFSARAAFAAFLGLLALLLLAGGISAILASLTLLFGFDVPGALYEHVWVSAGLFAAPLFAMGQLPHRFDEEPEVLGFMDRGLHALGDYLAVPLLILYTAILHLYALKIAVTWELPEGTVGWLVLVYGLSVLGVLLVLSPGFDSARAPTRTFLRLWPLFLIVPLVLLFFALSVRIEAFGVSPERYLLGLFGAVTAIILVLQFVPRFRADIRVIAGLPVAALILASFGPHGALGVSLTSQTDRFLEIVRDPPVGAEREKEALGALAFLDSHKAAARVAPEDVQIPADDTYMATAKAWGLDPHRPQPGLRGFMLENGSDPVIISSAGFDTVAQNVLLATGAKAPIAVKLPSGPDLSFALEADAIIVTAGEKTIRFPISGSEIERLARLGGRTGPAEVPLDVDGHRLMLVPTYLYADVGEPPRLQNLQGTILLRSQDWNTR